MNPYLLLAMQGGGAYGSYQAGMLAEYFERGGQPYDGGYGVSVGGLNVAQLFGTSDGSLETSKIAQAPNAARLATLWESEISANASVYIPHAATGALTVSVRKLLGKNLHGDLAVAMLRKQASVYDTSPLRKLLHKHLGHKKWPDNVCVGAVQLQTGEFTEMALNAPPRGMSAVDAVMASAAIPIVFPPIFNFVDGGVTDVTPLRRVFKQFNEQRKARAERMLSPQPLELHILRASAFPAPDAGPFERVVGVLERTLTLFVDNTDREDYERAVLINDILGRLNRSCVSTSPEIASAFQDYKERYSLVDAYVIGPSKSEMGQFSDSARTFDKDAVKSGLKLGRRRMADFLKNKDDYLLEVVHFNDDVPKLPR